MSDWATVLVAACASVAPTITALAAYRQSKRNAEAVEKVHKATNSMKDELVHSTQLAAFAAGKAEGKSEK